MACRGCGGGTGDGSCDCSIVGASPITVTGTGDVATPYTIDLDVAALMASITQNNTACESLNAPRILAVSATGEVYTVPLECGTEIIADAGGGGISGAMFAFTFSASTTDADPGDGFLKLNNATLSSVTEIYVDLADTNATSITAWLAAVGAGSRLRVARADAPANFAEYQVVSSAVQVGYHKYVVTYVASSGSFNGTTGNTTLSYTPGGTTGATGAEGSMATSFRHTFSTSTTAADPGSGAVRFSDADPLLATSIYLDDNDFEGTDIGDYIDTWNDSTNGIKGTLLFRSIADPAKWATFHVTAVTDNVGWHTITVVGTDYAGTLDTLAGDTYVSFARAGDAGGTLAISTQTTTYTLVLGDAGGFKTVGGAGNFTITIPLHASVAFPIGTRIEFWLLGNTVTFAGAVGVTVQSRGGLLNIATQYTYAELIKTATNTWILHGDVLT